MEEKVNNLKTDISVYSIPKERIDPIVQKKISEIPLQSLVYKKSKVLKFRGYGSFYRDSDIYEIPEYNLYEITAAEDADGIIRQAIKKKSSLMFKQGWQLSSENPNTKRYVELRFKQLGLSSRKPMEILLTETGADLIRYHNAFWVKVRHDANSGGEIRETRTNYGVRNLKPVAAYFRLPPETMKIKTDKYGNPTGYMQEMPDGRRQEFDKENVIHFYVNRRAGFNMACPGMWPAIEDIRSLRRIEENLELLVQQYLFPFFVFSVGTEQWPAELYEDGTTEVDVWARKINEMPLEGGLVVSHRHKLDMLGPETVLPVEKYLDYMKNRCYVSVGMSGVDFGEGSTSNRSTADSMSKSLIDDVKDYQRIFKAFLEFEVIQELLLEKFDISVLDNENIVNFTWNEIDLDNMMKIENHNALMYSMQSLTEDEMRHRNKLPTIDDDEKRQKLYMNTVELPRSKIEGSIKAEQKSQSLSKNKQQPTNQHGTNLGPTKRKSSLNNEQVNTLKLIFNHFDYNNSDLMQLQLTNWFFSVDLKDDVEFICNRFLDTIPIIVEEIIICKDRNLLLDVFIDKLDLILIKE